MVAPSLYSSAEHQLINVRALRVMALVGGVVNMILFNSVMYCS